MAAAGQVAADPMLDDLDRVTGDPEDVFLPFCSNGSRFITPGCGASRIAPLSDLLWPYSRSPSRSCWHHRR